MKYLFLSVIASSLLLISCKNGSQEPFGKPDSSTTEAKTPVEKGKELFEGRGNCIACHLVDKKVIGPSIQDIAHIYKKNNGDIVSFLKEESKPIVDPAQYEVMKTNFAITKGMTDEELHSLEAYIYSLEK